MEHLMEPEIEQKLEREHLCGYIHALEELTILIIKDLGNTKEFDLDNPETEKVRHMIVENIDYCRTRAVMHLGRLEMDSHPVISGR